MMDESDQLPFVVPHNSVFNEPNPSESQKYVIKLLRQVIKRVNKQIAPTITKSIPPGWVNLSEFIDDFVIDEDVFDQLVFRETLFVSVLDGNRCPSPVGALALDVQSARGGPFKEKKSPDFYNKSKKFLVHVASELDFQHKNGGSRITAWVDRNLQTLEEKRTEYLKSDSEIDEKHIYISTQSKCYYIRENKTTDKYYSVERAKNLICEGANFILMRYLAITRFIGNFEISTVYINGELCRNYYECKGPFSALINDQRLDVCKIYRKIVEQCGIVHYSATLLTLQGQILKQEWRNCDYILQINPLAEVKNEKPCGNMRIPLEKCFKSDLELMSRFLDTKCTCKKMIENYLHDHSEVKDMIADYVQAILQLKPDDVLEFTAKYFLNFTPDLLPRTEYFEKDGSFVEDEEDFMRYF